MAWYDAIYPQSKDAGPSQRPWYAFAGGGNQTNWAETGLANLTPENQLFYDTNPDLVNRAAYTYANANPLSHYRQFVEAQMPGLQQDFARYAVGEHAGEHYSDYVAAHYNDLAQQFAGLSAQQRGEHPEAFGGNAGVAGRVVYR